MDRFNRSTGVGWPKPIRRWGRSAAGASLSRFWEPLAATDVGRDGLKRDLPGKVIRWDAEWGTDFEVVGDNPVDVWRAEKEMYNALSEKQ